MLFEMNGSKYGITEVSQDVLQNKKANEDDEFYYGQTRYQEQVILLDEGLSYERKRKTLIHELTHVYLKEYITTRELDNVNEEVLCDIHANSHDIIHKIVEDYFNGGKYAKEKSES